jgi:hypothetical protein
MPFLGLHLSWKKRLPVLRDMAQFEALFIVAFDDRDMKKVVETKMQSLRQGTWSAAIYAA